MVARTEAVKVRIKTISQSTFLNFLYSFKTFGKKGRVIKTPNTCSSITTVAGGREYRERRIRPSRLQNNEAIMINKNPKRFIGVLYYLSLGKSDMTKMSDTKTMAAII